MLFEDVYERHFYRIYSYIRKHVNHQQDSEDLTADVFVTAYKYWHDYDPARCPVLAWLYMIASSRLKNYYRDRKNEYSLDIPEINDRIGSENYCDQAVVLMDERKTLASLLLSLSDRERTIILDKYMNNRTNQEIAESLGISTINVRVISTRAIQKMRALLDKYDNNEV